MDLFDFWWNYRQQEQIGELRVQMEEMRIERDRLKTEEMRMERDRVGFNTRCITALAEENRQLKMRLGLLVRLLISKGVFTAKEYSDQIAEAREEITAKPPSKPRRPGNKPL